MIEILSAGALFFAGHVASEAVIDRIPQLRAVCRGKTQENTALIIRETVAETIREEMGGTTKKN